VNCPFPSRCEGSVVGGAASAVILLSPSDCEASVMDQLCSSVTNFLDDESAKAGADLKNCKANCGWKKRKNDLITTAKKKAKDSCAKGEAPDINEINKGLDGNAKARLNKLYDQNNQMFDGTAKLAAKDLTPVPSNSATTLTGKGGQVTGLKSAEPATPKLNTPSEFSLGGTKVTGDTSNSAATKQSPMILASAAPAKTSADAASVSPAKSPAASDSDNTSGTSQDGETISQQEVCAKIDQGIKDTNADWERLLESDEKTRLMCGQWPPEAAQACYASADATKAEALRKYEETIQGLEKISEEAGCGRCVGEGQAPDADRKCCSGLAVYKKNCVTTCEAINGRIADINGFIAKWEKNPRYEPETDPAINWQPFAQTICDKDRGPHTVYYYEAFKALDPVLQKAIEAHEDVHMKQCVKSWIFNNLFIHWGYSWNPWLYFKGFPGSMEMPGYEVEKEYLQSASKDQCGL